MERFEAINPELKIENEILRARQELNKALEVGVRSGQLQLADAEKYRQELERILEIEAENRSREKQIEKLEKREASLEDAAKMASTPAGVVSGLARGSDEARRFLEQERLRSMAQKDAEPVVAELKNVRAEIRSLKEAVKNAANERPQEAALF